MMYRGLTGSDDLLRIGADMPRLRLIVWLVVTAFLAACGILLYREYHSAPPVYRRLPSGRLVPATPVAIVKPSAAMDGGWRDRLKAIYNGDDLAALQTEGRKLGALDPAAALDLLDELCPGWDKRGGLTGKLSVYLRAVLGAWAENDPQATAKWVLTHLKTGGDLSFALHIVAWQWSERDPDAALAWAAGLATVQGRECALRAAFEALAARNSTQAVKQLEQVPDFKTSSLALGAIAAYWAKQDIRSALAWAWKLPPGPGRDYAVANVALELFRSDRNAAASLLEKLPETSARRQTLNLIAAEWSRIDPQGAAARLGARLPEGRALHAASQVAIWNWALTDPAAAAAWAVALPDRRATSAKLHLLSSIASAASKTDSPAADQLQSILRQNESISPAQPGATATTSNSGSPASADSKNTTTTTTDENKTDDSNADDQSGHETGGDNSVTSAVPESAFPDSFFADRSLPILLMEQLPDGDARNGILHLLAVQWAREDPVAAITWALEQIPAGRSRDTTLQVLLWNWTQQDRVAAAQWAENHSDQAMRENAMATVAQAMAGADPATAAVYVQRLPAGEKKFSAIDSIVYRWTLQDTAASTAWALALTAKQGRDYAVFQVGAGRARGDLVAALVWANQQPVGATRDNAVGGVAYIMTQTDPARARTIAEGLADGIGRARVLAAIAAKQGQ